MRLMRARTPACDSMNRCQSSRCDVTCSGLSASRPVGPIERVKILQLRQRRVQVVVHGHLQPGLRAISRAFACTDSSSSRRSRQNMSATIGPSKRRSQLAKIAAEPRHLEVLRHDQLQQLDVEIEPGADPFARCPIAAIEDREHQQRQDQQQSAVATSGETSRWL